MISQEKLLSVNDLKVYFQIGNKGLMPWSEPQWLKAVDGVSFDIAKGETLGIVGESGCGKSTLARAVIRMVPSIAGTVLWMGQDLLTLNKEQMRAQRKDLQMIFQDPLASLDPRMTVGQIVAEPLKTHFPNLPKAEVKDQVTAMMKRVGLLPNLVNRYPHEFSGGQCQRIGIARALILKPKLIICDEPVSALDVSIQAQVINLLMELQDEMDLAFMFIAHDLSVVKHISTRIMVLYMGNVVEIAESNALYENPGHPYTRALIAAVPEMDPHAVPNTADAMREGDLPSPLSPPSGCVFRTRCPIAQAICAEQKPPLIEPVSGHSVACHFHRVS